MDKYNLVSNYFGSQVKQVDILDITPRNLDKHATHIGIFAELANFEQPVYRIQNKEFRILNTEYIINKIKNHNDILL